MVEFIRQHYDDELLVFYQENKIPASRSDIARLLLLYHYGGIYLDAAMEVSNSIGQLTDNDPEIVVARRDDFTLDRPHICSSPLGAIPRCRFIDEAIAMVRYNIRHRLFNNNVWKATGPHTLNLLLPKYAELYKIEEHKFSQLLKTFFVYRRVHGVSNSWGTEQGHGIYEPLHVSP